MTFDIDYIFLTFQYTSSSSVVAEPPYSWGSSEPALIENYIIYTYMVIIYFLMYV